MWEAAVGFKYEKGYGMQVCLYYGNSWEDAYNTLNDAFYTATGECVDEVCSIEQGKPLEFIDSRLPEDAPSNAIGVVYAITNSYD